MAGQSYKSLIYALFLVAVGAVTSWLASPATGISILGCKLAGPDQFISSCSSPKFGDYEHAALWFGLEGEALANLKAADVIFTGSSRTMFAFSTTEVRSYFAARGIQQFNLGFGYEEQHTFFEQLAIKHRLHPRILVIGIDPYFSDRVSPPALDAMSSSRKTRVQAWAKKILSTLQPALCKVTNCSSAPTGFRSTKDGYFSWRGSLMVDQQIARTRQTQTRDVQVNVPLAAMQAQDYLERIGMPAACVVLVPMPTHEVWMKPDPVQKIAEAIGAQYVDADTGEDLMLLDYLHLSYDSAKRFSAEFVRAFDRLPQDCLRAPATTARL